MTRALRWLDDGGKGRMMQSDGIRRRRVAAAALSLTFLASMLPAGQSSQVETPKTEIAEKVKLLVRQLDADGREDRDRAMTQLIEIGPGALEHLPSIEDRRLTAEQKQRLRRIFPQLWTSRLQTSVQSGPINFSNESLPLFDALKKLSELSGNRIDDLRSQFNQESSNPVVNPVSGPFWQALDGIADQAGVSFYFSTENRAIGLVGRPRRRGPICYSGAIRFELQRFSLELPFSEADPKPFALARIEALYEPRLRPLMTSFNSAAIEAIDDKGRVLECLGSPEVSFPLERDGYSFPLTIKLSTPPRDAVTLARLAGEIQLSMPIQVDRFEFAELPSQKPSERAGAATRLTLNKFEAGEDSWTASIAFETQGEAAQVESHFRSAMEMEIYLENKLDGSRFKQNGGMNTVSDEPGKTAIEYLFVDAPGKPGDYRLVVLAPAGIGRVPVKFKFENVPLP